MTYIIPFTELGKNDIPSAGGKGAMLALVIPAAVGFVCWKRRRQATSDKSSD